MFQFEDNQFCLFWLDTSVCALTQTPILAKQAGFVWQYKYENSNTIRITMAEQIMSLKKQYLGDTVGNYLLQQKKIYAYTVIYQ